MHCSYWGPEFRKFSARIVGGISFRQEMSPFWIKVSFEGFVWLGKIYPVYFHFLKANHATWYNVIAKVISRKCCTYFLLILSQTNQQNACVRIWGAYAFFGDLWMCMGANEIREAFKIISRFLKCVNDFTVGFIKQNWVKTCTGIFWQIWV